MSPVYVPNPNPGASTPADLFEQLGAEMAARYGEAENVMIAKMQKLAARNIAIPDSMTERIKTLRELRLEGEAIAVLLKDPALVARMVAIAAADGEAAALARIGIADRIGSASQITGTSANAVGNVALQLSNDLDNMSARITRYMPDTYRRIITMTAPNILLGVQTFQEAQRRAVELFLAQGVRGFTDKAGKQWRIGTYAEMATRTLTNRAWQDANIATSKQAGLNLVSIIIGVNACKICAAHSGKIYSTDGTPGGQYTLEHATTGEPITVTVTGTLDSARAAGWNHPNCRCVVVAYLPGLPVAKGTTYDPQAEKDRDRLRYLERRVRDLKRREAASLDDVTAARYRRRVKAAQADIREHVDRTGMLRRNYREQLGFSDGRTPRLPAAPPPRPVAPPPSLPTVPTKDPMVLALEDARSANTAADPRSLRNVISPSDPLGKKAAHARLPEIFNGEYGNGLFVKVDPVDDVRREFGQLRMTTNILDKDGKKAGVLSRHFYVDENDLLVVHNELMQIEERFQGRGFSTAFTRHAEAYYRASGVDRVTIYASLQDGGYAWARAGFGWDVGNADIVKQTTSIRNKLEGIVRRYSDEDAAPFIEILQRMDDLPVSDPDFPTPMELATLGPNGLVGRQLMRGTDWFGVKKL